MNKVLTAAAAVIGVLFLVLAFGFYSRGTQIQTLNAELNATAQALGLCNQKNINVQSALDSQNRVIEQLKIDKEAAQKAVITAAKEAAVKWHKEAQKVYVVNATCAEQLRQIDKLHEKFYGGKK
jgi:hypothetical protein